MKLDPFTPTSGTDKLDIRSVWTAWMPTNIRRWQAYCPRCRRTWIRHTEAAGRRSFRRHMELVHGKHFDEHERDAKKPPPPG